MTARLPGLVDDLVAGFSDRPDSSARVLLVTIFGDSIRPRREPVWLSSLSTLVEPFGISDRLVRTSVQRLSAEGVLERRAVGRRSFYSVSSEAATDFARAEERIYHLPDPVWDGRWTLVIVPPDDLDPERRRRLGQRLGWIGFDAVTPGTFASPSLDSAAAHGVIDALGLAGRVVVLQAGTDDPESGPLLTRLSGAVDHAATMFAAFVERYSVYAELADSADELGDAQAFGLRTLVVHDHRRAVLADPRLPTDLLPPDWPGERAFRIAARLHRAVSPGADRHVGRTASWVDGPLPEPAGWVVGRFDSQAS